MSALTRQDIIKVFGDLDEVAIAEIIATGATLAGLKRRPGRATTKRYTK